VKILVVTSVFPNVKQPTLGVFVRERMFKVAEHCEVKVVAPVPWFPFIRYVKKGYRPLVPYREIQDGIEVLHPRFFNFPGIFKCFDGIFFFLSSLVTVLKLKRCFNFDVIDAHFAYPDGIGAVLLGKLFKKPVSVTVRGTIEKLSKYALRRSQITYALKRVDKVFTVCRALKGVVVGLGIPEDKMTVISNGVDLEKFKKIDRAAARMELKLPLDKKIIISVGGLVERKGFTESSQSCPK
jgi:teichuronic acid biosynthesis glycosyltransferase TuaC